MANRKLPKTQLLKTVQSEVFLGRLLGPVSKTALRLIGHVLKQSDKSVLIPPELMVAASATDRSYSWENIRIWFYGINNF